MAAPTLAAVAFVGPLATAQTTGTLTWQTGDVICALAVTEGAGAESSWAVPTTTGSGITLTQQQLHQSASNSGAGCYAGVATAGSSGTFTMNNPGGTSSNAHFVFAVYIGRGSAGIGLSTVAASTSRTVSFTPSGVDGLTIWTVGDWGAGAVQSPTPAATSHTTASPGPQASPQAAVDSTRYTYYVEELDDQTSAAAVSYGIGGTGTGPFTIIVFEMKASGGAVATVPIHPRFPSRVPIFRAANY